MSEQCPCGSGEIFSRCCGPYLGRELPAPTAEALMRSRYTAYVRNDVDYLEKTIVARNRSFYNARKTLEWNSDVVWKGLAILGTRAGGPGEAEGEVEFTVAYEKAGEPGEIHERSRFRKKAGRWFYVDGRIGDAAQAEPAAPTQPKVGRNEPCPCGSGKKFKRCCGA